MRLILKKFLLFCCFLSFLSPQFARCDESQFPKLQDSERIYSSDIFSSYLSQLKAFIAFEVYSAVGKFENKDILFLTDQITSYEEGEAESNRSFYEAMIANLRNALKSERTSLSDFEIQFLRKFCTWMYQNVTLLDAITSHAVESLDLEPYPVNKKVSFDDLTETIDMSHQKSLENSEYSGRIYGNDAMSDPHMKGNIPYILFHRQPTAVIRMPTVVRNVGEPLSIPSKIDEVEVIPEFKTYIEALHAKNQRHLFVNLLNKKKHRVEALRAEATINLEKDPEYGSAIYVVTLDKNSSFYWQKDEFNDLDEAALFKSIFIERMFDSTKKTAFHWSEKINGQKWRNKVERIVELVHDKHFSSNPSLSKEERQDFIEITYLEIVKTLMNDISPKTANISCMYSIDRGPSLLAVLFIDHQIDSSRFITKQDMMKVISLIVHQPVLLHNRSAFKNRVDRLTQALQRLGKTY